MRPLEISLHPFRAELAPVEGKVVTRLEPDYLVVFDLEPDPALLSAETAVGVDDSVVVDVGIPPARRGAIEMRAVAIDQLLFGDG